MHGNALVDAVRDAVVAFEADDYDVASRTRWAVTVIGHARAVEGRCVASATAEPCLIAVQMRLLRGWRSISRCDASVPEAG